MCGSRGITESNPGFLKQVDWTTVTTLTFEITAKDEIRYGYIRIDLLNKLFKYEVSGLREEWVLVTKESIEQVLQKTIKPHFLSQYITLIILVLPLFILYFIYSLLLKMHIITQLTHDYGVVYFFAGFTIYVLLLFFLGQRISKSFPTFIITENYDPLNSGFIKVIGLIAFAVLTNAIWDLLKYVFQ